MLKKTSFAIFATALAIPLSLAVAEADAGASAGVIEDAISGAGSISLKYLGDINIPTGGAPKGIPLSAAPFGGISGVAPVHPNQSHPSDFYWLSDDRADRGPVRFYQMKVGFDPTSGKPVAEVLAETKIVDKNGADFGPRSFDPEGLCVLPSGKLLLSQEGSLTANDDWIVPSLVELNPSQKPASRELQVLSGHIETLFPGQFQSLFQGQFQILKEWPVPGEIFPNPRPSIAFEATNSPQQVSGQQYNLSLEGLSCKGKSVLAALESAVVQDDTPASFDKGSLARIFKYKAESGVLDATFLYPLSSVQRLPGLPEGATVDVNGISEVLLINEKEALVLERGVPKANGIFLPPQVFLYHVNLDSGDNVTGCFSVRSVCPTAKPLVKTKLLNFNDYTSQFSDGIPLVDNLEAMFWGPKSPRGNPTLWIVSDNNFNSAQRTQILVFEQGL
jgi:hypothetical protein